VLIFSTFVNFMLIAVKAWAMILKLAHVVCLWITCMDLDTRSTAILSHVPTRLWTSPLDMKRPNTDSSVNKPPRKRLRPDGTPRGSHGGVRVCSGRKPKAASATTITVAVARRSHSPPAGLSKPAGRHIRQ